MQNNLKFTHGEKSKWFVISDLHHSHAKLIESRGFKTIEEHNRAIIDNWNNKVSNDDTVFMLGDMVLGAGQKSKEVYEDLLQTLNAKELYIAPGNHWAGGHLLFEEFFDEGQIDKYYRLQLNLPNKTVYFIPNYYEVIVNGQGIILSHYPILSFNKQSKGFWHCHGHSHRNLHQNEWIDANYYKGKVMDVSWEGLLAPISFDELKCIMDKREVTVFDHHNELT